MTFNSTVKANERVVTLGCRLNTYESEIIKANLEKSGSQDSFVVNTCSVTKEAIRKSKKAVKNI